MWQAALLTRQTKYRTVRASTSTSSARLHVRLVPRRQPLTTVLLVVLRRDGRGLRGPMRMLGSRLWAASPAQPPVDAGQPAVMYMGWRKLLLTAIAGRTSTGVCNLSNRHALFADWTGNAGGSTTCQSGHSQAPALCIAEQL